MCEWVWKDAINQLIKEARVGPGSNQYIGPETCVSINLLEQPWLRGI